MEFTTQPQEALREEATNFWCHADQHLIMKKEKEIHLQRNHTWELHDKVARERARLLLVSRLSKEGHVKESCQESCKGHSHERNLDIAVDRARVAT